MIRSKKNKKWLQLVILSICATSCFVFYHFEKKHSFVFNMEFDETRIPYISSSLGSQDGYFLVDLGASYNCSLSHDKIIHLKSAKPIGEHKFINLSSQVFSCPQYLLDNTMFLNINIQDLVVTEDTQQKDLFEPKDVTTKHVWKPSKFLDSSKVIGSLGNRLLKQVNFLLDFKKHILAIYPQNITPLINFPYKNIFNFKKIPFEFVEDLGFVCTVKVNGENKRFMLDTGSSISIMKASSLPGSQSIQKNLSNQAVLNDVPIKIKRVTFKLKTLHILDSFQLGNLDGLLGMDFFHDKRLFFDTATSQILILNL